MLQLVSSQLLTNWSSVTLSCRRNFHAHPKPLEAPPWEHTLSLGTTDPDHHGAVAGFKADLSTYIGESLILLSRVFE